MDISYAPRKLKGTEEFFHIAINDYDFTLSASVVIESRFDINESTIHMALKLLSRAHPLLRSKIVDDGTTGRNRYHFHEISDFLPKIDVLDIESSSWLQCFEESFGWSINTASGPLWSVGILKATKSSSGFTRTLIFNFHHAIIDCRSLVSLCLELLQHIQKLHDGITPAVVSHALMPSTHTLLGPQVKNSWLTKKLASALINSYLLAIIRGNNENQFLSIYPPLSEKIPDIERKTKVICFALSTTETNRICTLCKTYGASLDGFINAICARAMAWILASDSHQESSQALKIYSSSVLDTRHRIHGSKTCCGCYVSKVLCQPEVNPSDVDSETLWKLAQQCTKIIEDSVQNQKDLEGYKIGNLIGDKKQEVMSEEYKASRDGRNGNEVFATNFYGHYLQPDGNQIRLKEMYVAAAEHQGGPVFANNVLVIENRLCWTFTYFTNISGEEIAGLFHKNIKRVINSVTSK